MGEMILGPELRDARVRLGLGQEQMAARLHISLRAYGSWERGHVPANRTASVLDLIGSDVDVATRPGIETFSTAELITELYQRVAEDALRLPGQATSGNIEGPLGGGHRTYVYGRGPRQAASED